MCLLVEGLTSGKRVYLTASTAREHTNELWAKEGTLHPIETC